jgi:hypothetical protein
MQLWITPPSWIGDTNMPTDLFAKRAEALAMVALTGLPNVSVSVGDILPGSETDMLVSIGAGRLFGVVVKARRTGPVAADGFLARDLQRGLKDSVRNATFPVGVIAVGSDERIAFGWLASPLKEQGTQLGDLVLPSNIKVESATATRLKRAVREVKRWYDRRSASGTV